MESWHFIVIEEGKVWLDGVRKTRLHPPEDVTEWRGTGTLNGTQTNGYLTLKWPEEAPTTPSQEVTVYLNQRGEALNYISVSEAKARTGWSEEWIKRLLKRGDVPGAWRVRGGQWLIPADWNPPPRRRGRPTTASAETEPSTAE